MARFDVFETTDGTLTVVCQSPLFDHLAVRFVIPLIPVDSAPSPASRLNPRIEFEGQSYLAFPQWSAGMPKADLRRHAGNLEAEGLKFLDAMDMLMSGI